MERSGESTAGICSLVLSFIPIPLIFLLVFLLQFGFMLALMIFCVGISLELIALGLGIIGIFQKTKRRVCAFGGTAISTACIICLVYLVLPLSQWWRFGANVQNVQMHGFL